MLTEIIDLGGGINPVTNCDYRIVIDIQFDYKQFNNNIKTFLIKHNLLTPFPKHIITELKKICRNVTKINISKLLRQFYESYTDLFEDFGDYDQTNHNYIKNIEIFTNNVIQLIELSQANEIRICDDLISSNVFIELFLHKRRDFIIESIKLQQSYLYDNQFGDFEIILSRRSKNAN